jgi:hypothetical protein
MSLIASVKSVPVITSEMVETSIAVGLSDEVGACLVFLDM